MTHPYGAAWLLSHQDLLCQVPPRSLLWIPGRAQRPLVVPLCRVAGARRCEQQRHCSARVVQRRSLPRQQPRPAQELVPAGAIRAVPQLCACPALLGRVDSLPEESQPVLSLIPCVHVPHAGRPNRARALEGACRTGLARVRHRRVFKWHAPQPGLLSCPGMSLTPRVSPLRGPSQREADMARWLLLQDRAHRPTKAEEGIHCGNLAPEVDTGSRSPRTSGQHRGSGPAPGAQRAGTGAGRPAGELVAPGSALECDLS